MNRPLRAAVAAPALAALLAAGLAAPAFAQPAHCPPGHAKKGWCSGAHPGWRVGDRVSRDRYVVISDRGRYRLPDPGAGRLYVSVDNDLLLIAAATGLILEVLGER